MSSAIRSYDDFVLTRDPALLRFAYSLTGDRGLCRGSRPGALVKALRRWSGQSALDRPEAYVRRIVINTFLSWHRRRSSKEVPGPVPDQAVPDVSDTYAQQDLVWRLLGELPRRQRAVLVLRYYEGLPDREIAGLLGCAEGTVRSLAARSFQSLRRHPRINGGNEPVRLSEEIR